MRGPKFHFGWLSDPRLAVHALNPMPVWLWSADARHILWANPAAAAIWESQSPAPSAPLKLGPTRATIEQITRLALTLQPNAAPRLERLRGFGAAFGGMLTCLCSRIALADDEAAILVVSTERAGKTLTLAENAQRLLGTIEQPAAIFRADGELIESSSATHQRLGGNRSLAALGAVNLAREATLNGIAEGAIPAGSVAMLRLDGGDETALLVAFSDKDAQAQEDTTTPSPAAINPPSTGAHRLPFRFVWQINEAGCFTHGIENFAQVVGARAAPVLNRPWTEIAATLNLDPKNEIAKAMAARETWSGIVVSWPIDSTNECLSIEMSGLPVYDRNRQFVGYRGFGICRDRDRLEALRQQSKPTATAQSEGATGRNVLRFPAAPSTTSPSLSPGEHNAFQELARELSERLKKTSVSEEPSASVAATEKPAVSPGNDAARDTHALRPILDRLPTGILVYRGNDLIYANRAFLDWTGHQTLDALAEAGGLGSLFIDTQDAPIADARSSKNNAKSLTITTVNGKRKPVEGHLFSISWHDQTALSLVIDTQAAAGAAIENALRALEQENQELKAVLDTAADGVLVLDGAGRILSANRSAQALFGYDAADFNNLTFGDLFASESKPGVLTHLERLVRERGASTLDAGREAIGRVRQGGLVPLYIIMGWIEGGEKLCVVLRDMTAWKRTEEELTHARQEAERASNAKSEFLAKISHEIRTPLNAIIGFSEVMMDERFGSIGNDRYRQYLKDIHTSGGHLLSLLNDLLDLSKIEAGKLELTFVSIDLNALLGECVTIMQDQANRERVIIRTSLATRLPQIVADARSVRQIVLNILSNSIKFTQAGGQVIVSTAVNGGNEVVLRVRDTGIGMSEKDLQTALEPFRQLANTARWGTTGTGLGLPITKALTEANHARLRISSRIDEGTLVEIVFPTTQPIVQ